jgi:hypothetical protein
MLEDGGLWTIDAAPGWSAGKPLRYPGGIGNPAAQSVFRDDESTGPYWVVADRNNDSPGTVRNSILFFNLISSLPEFVAGDEYDLTADLPPGARVRSIAWMPSIFLGFFRFFDESKSRTIDTGDYQGNPAGGLLFVGLDNGLIYAYALHEPIEGSRFTRVQTIASGLASVNGLEFLGDDLIWAACDDRCDGRSALLEIDPDGRFVPANLYERPVGMPNVKLEGFTRDPTGEATAVLWSDAANTDNHALRRATLGLFRGTGARTHLTAATP